MCIRDREYFISRAFNSHIPNEINISRNKISFNGFIKILPYLLKVQTANLANTGLGEKCLEHLSKVKGGYRLNEMFLSENGMTQNKNQNKMEGLKKMGLKVVYH